MFCTTVSCMLSMTISVQASGDISRYNTNPIYMDKVFPNIKVIAQAYLVGTDNKATIGSWNHTVNIDKVPPGTKIQGKTIPAKYLPQDNIENLKQIFSAAQGYTANIWINGAYVELEGAKLNVVAYDDKYVTFWSNGYKAFSNIATCAQRLWQLSNPAGFYRVERRYVWLDTGKKENKIPAGETIKKAGTGKVTSAYLGISPIPGIADSGDVYKVPQNTQLTVVSASLFESVTPGKTKDTYYKVAFKANTATRYLYSTGYYYVQSKYINLYKTGAVKPGSTAVGTISGVGANKYLNVRSSPEQKDNVIGYLQNGAKVDVFEKNSNWATIYFNSQKAYVMSSYISGGTNTPSVKDVQKLRIKNITENKYVLTWDTVPNCTDYRIFYTTALTGGKTLYSNYHCKTNSMTVNPAYFMSMNRIYVKVAANFGSSPTKSASLALTVPPKPKTFTSDKLKSGKTTITAALPASSDYLIQYSTTRSYANSKIIRVKAGRSGITLKNLKPNTTYYLRAYNVFSQNTDAGKKEIRSQSSTTRIIKTK